VLIRRIKLRGAIRPTSGIVIDRVTPQTVSPWMRAIAKGFSQEITVAEEVFGGFAALPGALTFLARIEDKVVGGVAGASFPRRGSLRCLARPRYLSFGSAGCRAR